MQVSRIYLLSMKSISHNCKEELKALDLRATPARIAIMQLLESSKEPLDVQMIMDYLQKEKIATDPATVFRIMNMYSKMGIANPIELQEGKTRYELASKADHHHLVCENCGSIEDIEDTVIPSLEKHIQNKHNFLVKRHSLEFFGLCKNCQG